MIEALGEAGGKVAILHFKQAESCRQALRDVELKVEKLLKQEDGSWDREAFDDA